MKKLFIILLIAVMSGCGFRPSLNNEVSSCELDISTKFAEKIIDDRGDFFSYVYVIHSAPKDFLRKAQCVSITEKEQKPTTSFSFFIEETKTMTQIVFDRKYNIMVISDIVPQKQDNMVTVSIYFPLTEAIRYFTDLKSNNLNRYGLVPVKMGRGVISDEDYATTLSNLTNGKFGKKK